MKCPNCNETLLMTERNNIEIDYCPACRGVWLDKGELDKIIDHASQNAYTESSHQSEKYNAYKKEKDEPGYRKPHQKRSFLSDLFDFG
jgi:uncharacterized protein